MGRFLKFLTIIGIFATGSFANAASSPFGLAIVPGIQYPSDDFILQGMRISALWGNQAEMYGLDFGALGNVTQAAFGGTAISGIFNVNKGTTNVWGLQFAGIGNYNLGQTDIHGLQLSLLMNYNPADASIHGLSIAPLNLAGDAVGTGSAVGHRLPGLSLSHAALRTRGAGAAASPTGS